MDILALLETPGIETRPRNALLRHHERKRSPRYETADQLLADLALPFKISPLRVVHGLGVDSYEHLQSILLSHVDPPEEARTTAFLIATFQIYADAARSAARREHRADKQARDKVQREVEQMRQELHHIRAELQRLQNIKIHFLQPSWLVEYGLPIEQLDAVRAMTSQMISTGKYPA